MAMTEFLKIYALNWASWWPQLLTAAGYTLALTALAFLLAVVIGVALALARLSHRPALRRFARGYVELMRGIPTLALLFLLYFGLPPLGILLNDFVVGFVGLGLVSAGYVAEIFRSGIEAMHRGQREAALAVGMTPLQAFRQIILPQATRIMLPPLLNMLIVVLKDSSVCSIISTPELMLRAKDLATESFLPMHLYLLAGAMYFAMAAPLSMLVRRLEIHMRRGLRS